MHLAAPKTAARSAFIVEAARQAGLQPAVGHITLSAMPAMPETFNAIKAAILEARHKGETPVVNFYPCVPAIRGLPGRQALAELANHDNRQHARS